MTDCAFVEAMATELMQRCRQVGISVLSKKMAHMSTTPYAQLWVGDPCAPGLPAPKWSCYIDITNFDIIITVSVFDLKIISFEATDPEFVPDDKIDDCIKMVLKERDRHES